MPITSFFIGFTHGTADGFELPPLPLGLPKPERIGSHHFDSLLSSPKNQTNQNGCKRVDPFDVFYVRGNPYEIVGVDEIYAVQEEEEQAAAAVAAAEPIYEQQVETDTALQPKEIKKAATCCLCWLSIVFKIMKDEKEYGPSWWIVDPTRPWHIAVF